MDTAEPPESPALPSFVGTLCLVLGAGILFLRIVNPSINLLPRSWFVMPSLWFVGGIAVLVFGAMNLWDWDRYHRHHGNPHFGRSPFQSLVVYTRSGCHLCDEAIETLGEFRHQLPTPRVVDIDSQPELIEKFTTCVPVVEIDGRVRFRGKLNPVLLQRLIHGAQRPSDA